MTNTQAQAVGADREAAADLLDEISNLLDHNGIGLVADLIRDGEYDDHEAVMSFARHRIAAAEAMREAAAKVADDVASECIQSAENSEYEDHRREWLLRSWGAATLVRRIRALPTPQTKGGDHNG